MVKFETNSYGKYPQTVVTIENHTPLIIASTKFFVEINAERVLIETKNGEKTKICRTLANNNEIGGNR